MQQEGLYLILSEPVAGYIPTATAAVAARVPLLQLRIKSSDRQRKSAIAQALRTLTAGSDTKFIINDDLELAMQVDADGLHIGQNDLSLRHTRPME